ncbi:hypothetical protein BRADI_2g39865v3, partial [Brachypodium distachyon]
PPSPTTRSRLLLLPPSALSCTFPPLPRVYSLTSWPSHTVPCLSLEESGHDRARPVSPCRAPQPPRSVDLLRLPPRASAATHPAAERPSPLRLPPRSSAATHPAAERPSPLRLPPRSSASTEPQ